MVDRNTREGRAGAFILLGVDFGATPDEARRAFVRKTRELKRDPSSHISEEELTEALHNIEQVIENPDHEVDIYRVPADPRLFEIPEGGLFTPPPAPLRRSTAPITREECREIADNELSRLIDEVLLQALSPGLLDSPYDQGRTTQ